MLVWRRWVFPILMVVIFGVIAAGLTKIAFFPDPAAPPALPSAEIADPVFEVARGDVSNALTLTGTIARDEAYAVRSTRDGEIDEVHVADGQAVEAGQVLVTIVYDQWRYEDIVAPEAGDISELTVMEGQPVSLGGDIATLTPARYHVHGDVQAAQLYRLVGAPTEGTVTIPDGPAPFVCTGLTTAVSPDGTTSVRCAVPADQIVFAGLPVTLDVRIGTASGVLVVPLTAVKGGARSGVVWVDDGADGLEERTVALGVNDGTRVEVTEGLAEGDRVREFVPGTTESAEPVCYDDGRGGQYCEEPGWNW
ncbi:efflux RND transporter periplasmic adaptor subunit [Microbacterium sp. No. 7]|uniref:efflux RND transporter periplasmic adaptor subunit n=1 Tax=Microbacterium sp. No. 7 TaxID=1714373 RepID=UPI0006D1667A|nr:HlyD family efflux transporter periplasmic adaptor subunit [Microbacterium sp. No. 7]ALJ21270.1 hypothetical protein AOA12_15735 [Microbacterium sp. No. 7]